MRRRLYLVLGVLAVVAVAAAQETVSPWRAAAPDHVWSFPRDLYAHPDYKTEWWYLTGNLERVGDGRPLGYQLTFFRSGLAPADTTQPAVTAWDPVDLIMGHAAVSDPAAGRHLFSEVVWRTHPMLGGFGAPGDSTLAWCRAPAGTNTHWSLTHDRGIYRLQVRDDARSLRYDLECRPTLPPLFHGRDGFSPKSATGDEGSLYFSHTRMETRGTVYLDGVAVAVKGTSWLDREIFTSTLANGQVGWDWLALRLDDGERNDDYMLYRLRDADGATDFALGTWRHDGDAGTPLTADRWNLEALETWTSPETGSPYPVRWKLSVPGQDGPLLIEALFPEQENVSTRTGIHYWEGAVQVRVWPDGAVLGRGFVELTGYGSGSRPPI